MPATPESDNADLALVRRAQTGDVEAFDSIVSKYQSDITAMLFHFAPARADLEDMVQETFIRAWRGLPQWRREKPFVHWLKKIASNVGLSFYRNRGRTPFARLANDNEETLARLAAEPERAAGRSAEEVRFILAQVPADDRALLTLLYLQEMSLPEIAEQYGWSHSNAKIKAFRARRRLKAILTKHGYTLE